ncbi:hypothetical protein B0H16DRAFT_1514001 [Mycena metata]|uniref:Uncharacterized protein n=1 Tax=Mycena metata TaxID=1033252 RepID=A0AAD7JXN2_9AGAR|nr:hypothetical protein B0H16DRAFT_1514001 [Mycena metata]
MIYPVSRTNMGVADLLPMGQAAIHVARLSDFGGKSLAVDISCLLHQGLHGVLDGALQAAEASATGGVSYDGLKCVR